MARTATTNLPEFLRSKAVGAVIAEALDASTDDELARPGAVTEMIHGAAREIRDFHGLPMPETQQGAAPRLVPADDGHRDMDEWTRTEPEADQG